MRRIGEHAVVIGGSMAGLLAARSLTEAYERVTVIERDALPAGLQGRRAVPQGRHAHALLPHGQACLDALLPGFSAELVAAGAPTCAALEEMRFVIGGHQLARASTGASSILASRPFIEGHVRRRVRALPQVTLIDGCDALGLTASRDGERVTGVRILRRADGSAEETLAADLVVAATGRAARIPAWLEALGYPRPAEERLDVGVTYASRRLSLPADPLDGDKFVLIGARPGPPAHAVPVRPGRRSLDPRAGRLRPRAPPAERPRRLRRVRRHRRSARRARGDRGRRAARGDRDAPLPRQRPPPLRPPAQLPGRAAGRGRRDLLVQPDLRAGHDRRRRRGGRAARLPRARRARPRPPLLQRRRRPDRSRLAAVGRRRPGAARGRGPAARARAPRQRLSAPPARDGRARPAPSPAPSSRWSACASVRPTCCAPRSPSASRAARAPLSWSERVDGVRRRELRVGEIRTPLREAGPPDAREAVVFLHGNPGSSADWEPLLAATGRRWRAVAWDAPGFGHAAAPAEFRADRRGTRASSSAARSTRSGSSAPISSPTTSAGPGACVGGRRARPLRQRGAARHRRAARLPLARARAALAHPARRRAAHGRHDPPRLSARCCGAATRAGCRGRSSTACTTTSTATPGAPCSSCTAPSPTWPPPASGSPRRCARSTGPRSCSGAATTPTSPSPIAERQRAAFPHAEIRVLERSGHWPFVDDPATVTAALTGFLARHAGAPMPPSRPLNHRSVPA